MNMYRAMYARKSVRKFKTQVGGLWKNVDEATIEKIQQYIESVDGLFDIRVDVEIVGKELLSRAKGFGKVKAPHYMVIRTEKEEGYLQNVGYVLQHIAVYLSSIEIGSCYCGGMKIDDDRYSSSVIIVAFGYAAEQVHRENIINIKRHKLNKVCLKQDNFMYQKYIEAARIAPSALNLQPARLEVNGNNIHVFQAKSIFNWNKKLLDMQKVGIGIVMANMAITAKEFGNAVNFEIQGEKMDSKLDYFITFVIQRAHK